VPEPQILLTGLAFPECPRWHDGRLWFSDWMAHQIIAVDPAGKSEVVLTVPFATFPFCVGWLPDGRMLISSASDRPLLRREADGSLVDHADLRGFPVQGWNELLVDGRGNAYVNAGSFDFSSEAEAATGIIVLVTPDGTARQVADGIAFANGMAITPDNGTFLIAESYGQKLTAYDVAADGSLSKRRVWAELDGYPDGICLDADGAVWYADVPNKHCVRVREGGEVLQTIALDRGGFACVLGGDDRQTLFMLTAEWNSQKQTVNPNGTGQVVTAPAPGTGAGWP
jgi:sugar lactone lactonase YvrE